MMNFVLKVMKFVLKMMMFVFKMTNLALEADPNHTFFDYKSIILLESNRHL